MFPKIGFLEWLFKNDDRRIDDGKLTDVLIKQLKDKKDFLVSADKGKKEVITSVPGITRCFDFQNSAYHVTVDRRYNPTQVMRNVVTAIRKGK